MSKKSFNIIDFTSKEDILSTLEFLGSQNLTETGHGYEIYGPISIKEASKHSSSGDFLEGWKEKPAIGIMMVVLAANRNFNVQVEPKLRKVQIEDPHLKTICHLSAVLSSKSQLEFYSFWGHRDHKKYTTLKNILSVVEQLRKTYPDAVDDFDLMNRWGNDADVLKYEEDPIGSLPNVAVATFQHLRMVFGVDTVKPDQRVKEVLHLNFGLPNLSDIKAIKAVEQIAQISGLTVFNVDQIFVKYGSSYNNQRSNSLSVKQIALNLKNLDVDNHIISKATKLPIRIVESLQ